MKRTCKISDLGVNDEGSKVILCGWVHRLRDHGSFIFLNLRDRSAIVQCLVLEGSSEELFFQVRQLKCESCIAVQGEVCVRPKSMRNEKMKIGDVEIKIEDITVFSMTSTDLPFKIEEHKIIAKEDLRLKYRYLDLRSGFMKSTMKLRHRVLLEVRKYLDSQDFWEIETPILIKSTPEGARDFLVPSRLYPGHCFALPQSPQIFKQILMVGGIERYFQIARCFRDEDLRGDRQPEFTQIDIEMSFVDTDDILILVENLMAHIFQQVLNIKLSLPFLRLTYHQAMGMYGSDKPDLRFSYKLVECLPAIYQISLEIFNKRREYDGNFISTAEVKGLVWPDAAKKFSRKQASEFETIAKNAGLDGLLWFKYTSSGLEGGASRFFVDCLDKLADQGVNIGDVFFIAVGSPSSWIQVCTVLGEIRNRICKSEALLLTQKDCFEFCWIVNFPFFEYDNDRECWTPTHHMFTMPQQESLPYLEKDPGSVLANLYDLVLNGNEVASGSIRVHDPDLQKKIFLLMGYTEEQINDRFGFILEAFHYGPPPHGGIALGVDRIIMLLVGEESIREVIAFPKNTQGCSPMDGAPGVIGMNDQQELKRIIENH